MNIFLYVLLINFIFLLQGCVATTFLSTAIVSAKVAVDPRTIGTQIDDSILNMRISNAIYKNTQIRKTSRINVTVYRGKVLLIGQVPNPKLALYAKQIAMNIKGTTEVYNEIRQTDPINSILVGIDIWNTVKVYSKLLISNKVNCSNLKIVTENGEVFLFGLVTKFEGKCTLDIVKNIHGIKYVKNFFIYTD